MLLDTSSSIISNEAQEETNDQRNINLEAKQGSAALLTHSPSHSLRTTASGISGERDKETGPILPVSQKRTGNIATNIGRVFANMNKKSHITLNLADPATKPLYAITPTDSVASMEESSVATPSEIGIGIHESDSTTRLQPGNNNNMGNNQDSSESLISHARKEKWYTIMWQVTLPYLIAGLGMVFAGYILDKVQHWKVFVDVPQFLVLATPLLGLKGNLEMTLASRLSTHANLGTMSSNKQTWDICFGNMSLVQVQAIVVGFLASLVAIFTGVAYPEEQPFLFQHALLLCTSSMVTAAVASFILGLLMIFVILVSKWVHVNPDNIATPIAASLGDVTTLGLLAIVASWLDGFTDYWIHGIIIGIFITTTPVWIYIAYNNEYTRNVLVTGWAPVIIAMLISSGGGVILDYAKEKFPQLALYQPVINGVGGNLVSVQASRISTALHRDSILGELPESGRVWRSPISVFMGSGVNSVAARVLLAIVIPGHLIFSFVTTLVSDEAKYSIPFMGFYLTAAVLQVAVLLYLADILVSLFWAKKIDPDTNAIPYLTALGDLLGTGLLYIAFSLVDVLSRDNVATF